MIIPQAEPAFVVEAEFVAALADPQPGAGGGEDRSEDRDRSDDADGRQLNCEELMGNVPGGASSPESGANGSTQSTSAASHASPPIAQSPAVLFAHWREVAPRLPRPPEEELMDPPKART